MPQLRIATQKYQSRFQKITKLKTGRGRDCVKTGTAHASASCAFRIRHFKCTMVPGSRLYLLQVRREVSSESPPAYRSATPRRSSFPRSPVHHRHRRPDSRNELTCDLVSRPRNGVGMPVYPRNRTGCAIPTPFRGRETRSHVNSLRLSGLRCR